MARRRKRHVQQELFRHGGKRKGAGRKPKGERAGSPHKKRPTIKKWEAGHVVLRIAADVAKVGLRKRFMYRALREATIAVALRELAYDDVNGAFRIVHMSIQRNHVHLLVEADNKRALWRGMQSFQISAARHINRELGAHLRRARTGNVFVDRYYLEVIKSPRQARRALSYVLNNWRKHREDRDGAAAEWNVDPFSSAVHFFGWKEREDAVVHWRWRDTYDPLVVYQPKTWLLREGWLKHGRISFFEVPSKSVVAG